MLLSITARAEQEPAPHVSVFDRDRPRDTGDLVHVAADGDGAPLPIVRALAIIGDSGDLAEVPDEIEPNGTLKSIAQPFPKVNRSAKGDPFIGLRPGYDARRRNRAPNDADPDGLRFQPRGATDPRDAEFDPGHSMSPERPGDGAPSAPGSAGVSFGDGATPGVPLDFALNSSTPTSSDGVLVVVETDASQQTTVEQTSNADGKPNYASLIDPKDNVRQMRCLAEAIYFESRGEPQQGQAAVAQVVLNRVRSGIYPTTVCGVVYQDRNRPFACQFSFACEGKSLRIEEPGAWAVAARIAGEVVSGKNYNPRVGEAVNYHATYVAPFWTSYLRRVDRIGNHIFYAMRAGANWAPGALNGRGDLPPVGD